MFNKHNLIQAATEFLNKHQQEIITQEIAISPELINMKIYGDPIFGFAAADDEIFRQFQDKDIIGDHFLLPEQWMAEAKTVISFFLPFTGRVITSNATQAITPSPEWLHGRIEGQQLLIRLCKHLQNVLHKAGHKSIVPSADERFWTIAAQRPDLPEAINELSFTSNWSERHVAYACGLGTFSLSKGLITQKGTAGRFGSLITSMVVETTARTYTSYDQYCTKCGRCIAKCPVDAISMADGKDHKLCSAFLDDMLDKFKPRYGCGKCQVGVPCESEIPFK